MPKLIQTLVNFQSSKKCWFWLFLSICSLVLWRGKIIIIYYNSHNCWHLSYNGLKYVYKLSRIHYLNGTVYCSITVGSILWLNHNKQKKVEVMVHDSEGPCHKKHLSCSFSLGLFTLGKAKCWGDIEGMEYFYPRQCDRTIL